MHCRETIAWYDLLPVVSFALLSARCRHCGRDISWQYPLVELLSMTAFLLALALHPREIFSAFSTGMILWALLIASAIDLQSQTIPDLASMVIAVIALANALLGETLPGSLLGGTIGFLWFAGQWALSRGRWVGSGDIFLAAALGLWLGTVGTIAMLVSGYMLGAVAAVIILARRGATARSMRIPFVPFLAMGALLAQMGIAQAYLRLL
jgi:leader peptidase (prepilin peptidase)/N-methyltransferase